MIRVGIVGAAGYTAGELIRVLMNHPNVELRYLQSESHRGEAIGAVHQDLIYSNLIFSDLNVNDIDVLFLCMGHGMSAQFLECCPVPSSVRIVDLSNDFRLAANSNDFIYGLPERNREQIRQAFHVANPGCFATAIELGLLPFAESLSKQITVFGVTGATGAGQKLTEETHYTYRAQNLSVYKVFSHQHLAEISETLFDRRKSVIPEIAFVPVRGCHARGIMANMVFESHVDLAELRVVYDEYYKNHPFVWLSDKPVHLKQVVNTNYCFMHIEQQGDKVLITSVIDNLLKGASGQAVQNMNLMFGLEETVGLNLKASYF